MYLHDNRSEHNLTLVTLATNMVTMATRYRHYLFTRLMFNYIRLFILHEKLFNMINMFLHLIIPKILFMVCATVWLWSKPCKIVGMIVFYENVVIYIILQIILYFYLPKPVYIVLNLPKYTHYCT